MSGYFEWCMPPVKVSPPMTDPEVSPITVLAVGLTDNDEFRELSDVLTRYEVQIKHLPADAGDDDIRPEALPNCHLVLFSGDLDHPPHIVKSIWTNTRTPAVCIYGAPKSLIPDPCVFAAIPPDCPPHCFAPLLAIAATRGREHAESMKRIHQLERSLEGRRAIEQAKWKLIQDEGITEPDAHTKLQRVARSMRIPLPDVAKQFLEKGNLESMTADS